MVLREEVGKNVSAVAKNRSSFCLPIIAVWAWPDHFTSLSLHLSMCYLLSREHQVAVKIEVTRQVLKSEEGPHEVTENSLQCVVEWENDTAGHRGVIVFVKENGSFAFSHLLFPCGGLH